MDFFEVNLSKEIDGVGIILTKSWDMKHGKGYFANAFKYSDE